MQTGLALLQRQLKIQTNKNTCVPIYSFITQLIALFKQYLNSQFQYSWAQYLICNKKHQTIQIIKSWLLHNIHSLEAQLLNTLLLVKDIRKCKLFLRLRKYVVQLTNVNMLDQIVLRHQDAITIIHRMFPLTIKKEIMNGIKQIFISYKVPEARIYACVFIQYILSIYDSIDSNQQSFMVGQTKISDVQISNFSTINKFNSNLHKQNGLYRKVQTNQTSYTIIQTKFLPQKFQKQKTKFQQEPFGSQYYSNSLNFSQENGHKQKISQKQNWQQNLNKNRESNARTFNKKNFIEQKSQIKIEESKSQRSQLNDISNYSRNSIQKQMQEVMIRNSKFKNKVLEGKSSIKAQLSHEEQDSINETISIIHTSIVRNRRERQ